MEGNRVLVWGLGSTYNRYVNLLKFFSETGQFQIVGVTARSIPQGYTHIDGWPLLEYKDVDKTQFDYILVMSQNYYFDILQDVTERYAIAKERVLSFKILNIPNFDFYKYVTIKNSKITIFSNNCWGGMLYHSLGLECLSPFKNLSVLDDDYLEFLKCPKDYFQIDPEWNGLEELDCNSGKKVPMLNWGDILIKCNHYPDPYEAIEKWKRRSEKINWDNLLVEMYTENERIARKFSYLDYSRKMCFVPFDIEVRDVYHLPMLPGQKKFYETVNGAVTLEGNGYIYDICDAILGKINYRLKNSVSKMD